MDAGRGVSVSDIPRERLLAAAEELFTEHGFAAVKLRDIAQAAGLHHSTLYHHAPGGKVQLFGEAMGRNLSRHAAALDERLRAHDGDLRAQLQACAAWVLGNLAGNHTRMLTTDLPNLPDDTAQQLAAQAWRGTVGPIARALEQARARGEINADDEAIWVVAGALLVSLQSLRTAAARYPGPESAETQADRLLDVLLDGLRPRDQPAATRA
jgi:AcrR family transcriptional regulator